MFPPVINLPSLYPTITPTFQIGYPTVIQHPPIITVPTWNTGVNAGVFHTTTTTTTPSYNNVYPGDKFRNPYM